MCLRSLEPPSFEKADMIYTELLSITSDQQSLFEAGEFYIVWSSSLKLKKEEDFMKNVEKRVRYKDLAKRGSDLLERISLYRDQHKYHFLLAHAYFNLWENERALRCMDKAIELADGDVDCSKQYMKFRKVIIRQRNF